MADLYRKSSMDKLSNPEQLDRMIKISSPLSWLALAAVLIVVAAVVVWSIIGTLPTTEAVSGIIVSPDNVCAVYSDEAGTLEKYYKNIGDEIAAGDKIAEIKLSNEETKDIIAETAGKLSALSAEEGSYVLAGTEIARMSFEQNGSQVVVCYVPLLDSQKFEKGMKVLVYPAAVDSQKYGHMEAEIISVEEYAANTESMAYVLGSGNLVAEQYLANGPVVSLVCSLKTDSSSKNGFYWSGESGKNLTVSNGTFVSANVVVDECAPITKLIGKFKDDMEGTK
ncbi:MAG: biotin/lipoyl-containing protein [Ruminococcus sp.]